jgi:hypothetical protein
VDVWLATRSRFALTDGVSRHRDSNRASPRPPSRAVIARGTRLLGAMFACRN